MFTGIVNGIFSVVKVEKLSELTRYAVQLSDALLSGLQVGASVSIDGVCQTVIDIEDDLVWFEAIKETLERTTLKALKEGRNVNVERSIKLGDEVGGHLLSGHVYGTAQIVYVERHSANCSMQLQVPPQWVKYLFSKGFVALDGVSLTLGEVLPSGKFSIHLIPETLKQTTFGIKKEGELVNVEIDTQTQVIVETVEKIMAEKNFF